LQGSSKTLSKQNDCLKKRGIREEERRVLAGRGRTTKRVGGRYYEKVGEKSNSASQNHKKQVEDISGFHKGGGDVGGEKGFGNNGD